MSSLTSRLSQTANGLIGICLLPLMALPLITLPLITAKPAAAAERVVLTYGFLEVPVTVEALRAYSDRGEISPELAFYFRFLNGEQRSQFRQALQARQDVSPVQISKFLYSSIGENILRSLGTIVQTAGRLDGAKGLRSALVLAAARPEGLSVIGLIEEFPTRAVRIDAQRGLQAFGGLTQLIGDTQRAISTIAAQSEASPANTLRDEDIAALIEPGPYAVTMQTLMIEDLQRGRSLTTDLYLPEIVSNAPLVVISHGLAGDRKGFIYLAEHLASHGFAVAALDHPGSDRRQLEALLRGFDREIAKPTEFSDRPRDISYLLDELTRLGAANGPFANRLDMNRIGIIGHSFGGYTALALGGAQLNFDTLQANCASEDFIFNAANASMLLQCTALAAPEQFSETLKDPRIQAVMALNPVTSSLFGPVGFSQLAVPSLIVAGTADPVAPALLEQIQPFLWLNESDAAQPPETIPETIPGDLAATPSQSPPTHYLALIQGGSHIYDPIDFEGTDPALSNQLVNADIPLAYNYLKALSLGFMEAEINQNSAYRDALDNASIVQLGQAPLLLYIVNMLTSSMLQPVTEVAPPESAPTEAVPDAVNGAP